jgi:hypothetical protein
MLNELQMGEAIVKPVRDRLRFLRVLSSKLTIAYVFKIIIFFLVMYNLVFIPIQTAYRIEYGPGYMTMEVLTLLFYAIDIVL